MNLVLLQRNVKRFFESDVSTYRVQKRIAFAGCLVFVLFVYILFSSKPKSLQDANKCVINQFSKNALIDTLQSSTSTRPCFVGNGLIGLDTALDKQLLVSWPNDTSIKVPLYTAFRPLVDITLPFEADKFQYVIDEGTSKAVRCAVFRGKCFCLKQSTYAHRVLSNLLVQEIRISNPTSSFFELHFTRQGNSLWNQTSSGSLPTIYLKTFVGTKGKAVVAIVCSSITLATVLIKAQTEETFRFLCVVERSFIGIGEDEAVIRRKMVVKISNEFTRLNSQKSEHLDAEHLKAWKNLDAIAFSIDHSKATNALNMHQINATRHALLSAVRAPLLELSTGLQKLPVFAQSLSNVEFCYSGHSTLLKPSKLWQDWTNVQELLRTVEIWLLTLEHNGCIHLVESGANGVMYAFVLSLLAATFTHHRLEIALDPESDLHRQIHVHNLRVSTNAHVEFFFNLDDGNRPYTEVRLVGEVSGSRRLYACGAGCLEVPQLITTSRMLRFALKMTKPPTPILFIAENHDHLTQLRNTLHISEVVDAAPEAHKVDMHKHGDSGGLPTIFWAILIFMLVAFHLFLFQLLYSEWQNSSSLTHSKFSKRFLLKR